MFDRLGSLDGAHAVEIGCGPQADLRISFARRSSKFSWRNRRISSRSWLLGRSDLAPLSACAGAPSCAASQGASQIRGDMRDRSLALQRQPHAARDQLVGVLLRTCHQTLVPRPRTEILVSRPPSNPAWLRGNGRPRGTRLRRGTGRDAAATTCWTTAPLRRCAASASGRPSPVSRRSVRAVVGEPRARVGGDIVEQQRPRTGSEHVRVDDRGGVAGVISDQRRSRSPAPADHRVARNAASLRRRMYAEQQLVAFWCRIHRASSRRGTWAHRAHTASETRAAISASGKRDVRYECYVSADNAGVSLNIDTGSEDRNHALHESLRAHRRGIRQRILGLCNGQPSAAASRPPLAPRRRIDQRIRWLCEQPRESGTATAGDPGDVRAGRGRIRDASDR